MVYSMNKIEELIFLRDELTHKKFVTPETIRPLKDKINELVEAYNKLYHLVQGVTNE